LLYSTPYQTKKGLKVMSAKIYLYLFVITILINTPSLLSNTNVSPYIRIRSQGTNGARTTQGITQFMHHTHSNTYADAHTHKKKLITPLFMITPTYTKSNKASRIAESLFGRVVRTSSWDIAKLAVSGSGVSDRNPQCELLADYFGLPRDFKSQIILKPRIDNFIADLDLFIACNKVLGLWARIRAPIVYTRWDLNYDECVFNTGMAPHQPGYFNDAVTLGTESQSGTYADAFGVARDNLLSSFTDYVARQKVPNLGSTVRFRPLKFARFTLPKDKKRSKGAIADLHVAIGYDVWRTDTYHLGFGIAFVAPTGNRPEGVYAFEPMVGNGHHWEAGGIISGHYRLVHDEKENHALDLCIDARITHLFSTRQKRTFDLKGKPNSRYMLASKMKHTTESLFANALPGDVSGSTAPPAQFDNMFMPVANLSTVDANVSGGFQADATFMFAYTKDNVTWDAGYALWGRSCESIQLCAETACTLNNHLWVLKGDAHVYGFSADVTPPTLHPIALSPSQTQATITQGTNTFTSLDTDRGGCNATRPTRNPGVDSPAFARQTAGADGQNKNINDRPDNLGLQTKTSTDPVRITVNDFDVVGAQTKGLSHSFFAGFCYAWDTYDAAYMPFIGAGGQAEFHTIDRFCTVPDVHTCSITQRPQECSSCRFCGISQWSVWLKAGITYH